MAVGERERERGALNTGFVAAPGMSGAVRVAGIVAAPLALAALGLTHPVHLDGDTALWWHQLHIVLLPLFPLLGVNLWWLLAGLTGPLPWVGRIAGFVYIVFYGALDVLAGIAAGVVRERATQEACQPPSRRKGGCSRWAMRWPTWGCGHSCFAAFWRAGCYMRGSGGGRCRERCASASRR